MNRFLPRALMAPAVATLFLWMIVPLVMTLYFSVIRYNLMQPDQSGFVGLENFEFFLTDPSFTVSVFNTLLLLGSVIAITTVLGIGIAVGQQMSAALAGKTSVDAALKTSQQAAEREMKKAGYYK